MSDFVPHDILPNLWDEILRRHWSFLETEESMQKLEERKKLEGCLEEFLCVVPHNRKFFLPETSHVLRKSIREMDEFTAYKAIMGFESISQYANNLFTKLWRKEFRIIKMYSGFFQHEIKSNLRDAEKLFEAMGYRQVSSEILVLDGPICPDQVTNVSRDAMAAYMECQIMKQIYSALAAMGLTCTWQDVFHYREQHLGGPQQAIKSIAYQLQERRLRKEKLVNSESCYAAIKHIDPTQPQLNAVSSGSAVMQQCPSCISYHMTHPLYMHQQNICNTHCAVHSNNNNSCAIHPNANVQHCPTHSTKSNFNGTSGGSNQLLASYPAASYAQHGFVSAGPQLHHMSHSRSLEHYHEPAPTLPHRHSFDHQQQGCMAHHQHYYPSPQHLYESPYDCIDAASTATYAVPATNASANCVYSSAYAHPYNVSGNRYPLPYNISSQLNSHYATPVAAVTCNGVANEDTYGDNADILARDGNHTCTYHSPHVQLSPLPPPRHHLPVTKDFHMYRQRSFPPDQQLIDLDDCNSMAEHVSHEATRTRSQNNSFDYRDYDHWDKVYEKRKADRRLMALSAGVNRMNLGSPYAPGADVVGQRGPIARQQQSIYVDKHLSPDDVDSGYVYVKPRVSRGGDCGYIESQQMSKRCSMSNADKAHVNDFCDGPEAFSRVLHEQDDGDNNGKAHMELTASERGGLDAVTVSEHSTIGACDERDAAAMMDDLTSAMPGVEHLSASGQRSPTQATKNQDGVGSFESWDYVFQNLDRTGYSKDLGDRTDLLVQSLDLGSLNAPNASAPSTVDKRRPSHSADVKPTRQLNSDKSRTLEKAPTVGAKRKTKVVPKPQDHRALLKAACGSTANGVSANSESGNVKAALKSVFTTTHAIISNGSSSHNNNQHQHQHQQQQQHHLHHQNNNDDNHLSQRRLNVKTTERTVNGKRQNNANHVMKQNPVATQVIVTSPNEWSCRFCTFLNPDSKRICEMCCRSKDFNLDAVVSNTPTCV